MAAFQNESLAFASDRGTFIVMVKSLISELYVQMKALDMLMSGQDHSLIHYEWYLTPIFPKFVAESFGSHSKNLKLQIYSSSLLLVNFSLKKNVHPETPHKNY